MKFDEIWKNVRRIPHISELGARELYQVILDEKPSRILELGFAQGKSSAIMGAALKKLGHGRIDSVDLFVSMVRYNNPSAEELIEKLELDQIVFLHREQNTYNWWLKNMIQQQLRRSSRIEPIFDFVFIDGSHNFTIDTCAFTLVDRLLKTGSLILFDDLEYNYYDINERQNRSNDPPELEIDSYDPRARVLRTHMSESELREPHVGLIYNLLVKTHPNYGEFRTSQNGNWGWARKLRDWGEDYPKRREWQWTNILRKYMSSAL